MKHLASNTASSLFTTCRESIGTANMKQLEINLEADGSALMVSIWVCFETSRSSYFCICSSIESAAAGWGLRAPVQ